MIQRTKKYNLLLLIAILLLLGKVGSSQEKQSYRGMIQVGPYSGTADYQYFISKTDTIKDGTFKMGRSSLEALLQKEDASFLFKGNFKEGDPIGNWEFQFNDFETDATTQVVDLEYRVLINGVQEKGLGILSEGKLDGNWTYEVNQIEGSAVAKSLFKSEFVFSKGVAQQSFQIENTSTVLVGRFLRNGMAQDEWSSYATENIENSESWLFRDGILHNIMFVRDGEKKEVAVFPKADSQQSKTIAIDARYMQLVRATLQLNDSSLNLEGGISSLLVQNARYYKKMDTVIKPLGAIDFMPKLKVKVPVYPLDTVQIESIDRITKDFELAKAISKSLLNNSHFNIIKRSDTNALFNYKAVSQLSETYLKPIEALVHYQEQGILENMVVSKLIRNLFPKGSPSKRLQIAVDSTTAMQIFELPNASDFSFDGDDLESMSQIISYAKQSLQRISENMGDTLKFEQDLQNLNSLEENLIAKNDSLIAIIDSVATTLPKNYVTALQRIKELAETSLSDYAATTNAVEKLKFGNGLKSCFEQYIALSHAYIALPVNAVEINTLYTDAIWNPFMATVMEEDVKKRITNAYSEILIPYFLSFANKDLACENVDMFTNSIIGTNKKMVELREQDTKKLERKLRREKNPREIMKLLHEYEMVKEK